MSKPQLLMNKPQQQDPTLTPFVSPGMPSLDLSGKSFSFFEFWPTWLMYLPVFIQSLLLGVTHRSISLPLLANPELPLGGMVGSPKSLLLSQATGECESAILDWVLHKVDGQPISVQRQALQALLDENGFHYPMVCKPDIGCRGNGVQLVKNEEELTNYLSVYPKGASIMIQALSRWEPEAGVFFVKEPGDAQGKIISLALKYMPYVVGDGFSTLSALIDADPRASQLKHLYLDRHQENLEKVFGVGVPYRLIFSASHCKGAIFRNAEAFITPALTETINCFMKDLPEFYYGRLDIKFRDIEALQQGKELEIIEINAASSESLHIWDRDTSLMQAITALLRQYRILFRLGNKNRQRGYTTPGLGALLKGWQLERKLSRHYPSTD